MTWDQQRFLRQGTRNNNANKEIVPSTMKISINKKIL